MARKSTRSKCLQVWFNISRNILGQGGEKVLSPQSSLKHPPPENIQCLRPLCNPWPVPECIMTKAETGGKTATNSTKPAQKQAKCPPQGTGLKLEVAFKGCLVPAGMLCLRIFWGWGGKQGQRFGRENVCFFFFPIALQGFLSFLCSLLNLAFSCWFYQAVGLKNTFGPPLLRGPAAKDPQPTSILGLWCTGQQSRRGTKPLK